ncbi:MAG: hypothetical protein H0W02_00355 [Ktedonobacteraceae bacterium]|nr:hypothetical protein [Ktedonobacteraceae bacterium]
MSASVSERNRILSLVEAGQVTAIQAAQLLDALGSERERVGELPARGPGRVVRLRVTNLAINRQKANVTVPLELIDVALRLGTRLAPQIEGSALESLLRAIQSGATGRVLDLQDLEENERVEIFVE